MGNAPYRGAPIGKGIATLAVFLLGTVLVGCGATREKGGAKAVVAETGRATLSVRWPDRSASRLIPFAANSIRIRLTSLDKTRLFGETLLVRPTNGGTASASFDRLPPGPLLVTAAAFPEEDGSGVAQAQGQVQATIIKDQIAEIRLTLATAITQIVLTPSPVALDVGQNAQLTVTAKNATDEIVLTHPSTLSWSSLNTSVATVVPTGTVTAVGLGNTTISVTELESGKVGSVPVSVGNASTTLEVYEGFAYTPGATLTNQNGGTGWANPWRTHGPATPSVILSGNLTFGKLAVSGNSFKTTSFDPIGEDRDRIPLSVAPGTVRYWSVLMKPEAVSGGWPDSYFLFNIFNQAFGKEGPYDTIGIKGDFGAYVSTGIFPQPNTIYFMVARVQYGADTDKFDLFVNPTPGQPLPTTPQATKTVPHASNPHPQQTFGTTVPCVWDELRIGPTWESVSPTTP